MYPCVVWERRWAFYLVTMVGHTLASCFERTSVDLKNKPVVKANPMSASLGKNEAMYLVYAKISRQGPTHTCINFIFDQSRNQ